LVAFGALALFTHGRHLRDDLVLALAAFVAITIAQEFVRSVRARERIRHERWYAALPRLVWRNPRRYGGYVVHLGIVVMLAGIALHVAYKDEVTVSNLSVGQSATISGYTVTLQGLSTERTVDRSSRVATLGIARADGTSLGTVTSMRSVFVNRDQPATEVGIRSTPFADLYLVLQAADVKAGIASLALFVNPGVSWIWMGGLVVLAGGAIAGWPRRHGTMAPPPATREVSRDVPRAPVGASV
jgi:cytochrome c-type biogenesis protein CcmF